MSIAYKGFLIKRGQKVKNWKTRFFVLYDHGQLSYFKIKDEPEDLMTLPSPTGTLDLSKPNTLVLAGSSSKSNEQSFRTIVSLPIDDNLPTCIGTLCSAYDRLAFGSNSQQSFLHSRSRANNIYFLARCRYCFNVDGCSQ
eukprot:TRINITY_DN11101_c0_g3_i1.p2 TRINITY_DN11101_c0_g3~~TRINITY_DN11101_c0_g3_i1.p2  ORF type:complete len:140 (+),score=9.23 TRINITY_DN11101_c0_g3_i1:60-479(+)